MVAANQSGSVQAMRRRDSGDTIDHGQQGRTCRGLDCIAEPRLTPECRDSDRHGYVFGRHAHRIGGLLRWHDPAWNIESERRRGDAGHLNPHRRIAPPSQLPMAATATLTSMTSAAYAETVLRTSPFTVSGTGFISVGPAGRHGHLHSADDTVGRNHISSGSDFFGFWCACRDSRQRSVRPSLAGRVVQLPMFL